MTTRIKSDKKKTDAAKYNISKLNTFLNDGEIANLNKLEKISNKSRKIDEFNRDILNLSVRDLVQNWANENVNIFSDVVFFMSSLNKYKGYFRDIDETNNWTTGVYQILKDFSDIFIKDMRSIYFGATLVLISLLLYFIQITS